MNFFKKNWIKIKNYFFNDGKESLKDIWKKKFYLVEISNIDFFINRKVIIIKDDDDYFVKLIDVENYSAYYKKNIVAKILYKKKKNNKILLTFNKKDKNIFSTIYKASIEFHFFLSQCVTSKNIIFIQISFTGLDHENNKFKYFSNKIALKNNVNISFDIIFNLIKENIIDRYNFPIDIECIELYTYFIYNHNYQEDEINLCMNKYYTFKKFIFYKKYKKYNH